jgi:hypothetical protein
MFSFIDKRFWIIKHKHNSFLWNLNVLITSDFHQVPLVCDSWVFQPIDEGLNSLGINFGKNKDDVMNYVVLCNNKIHDEILNKFRKAHRTQ